jgi:hypothetical protein
MPYGFEATQEFIATLLDIDILLTDSNAAAERVDESRRKLYLKLCIVLIVSKLQVFIEKILAEYLYKIRTIGAKYASLQVHQRLSSLQINVGQTISHNKFRNPELFNQEMLEELHTMFLLIMRHFDDNGLIGEEHEINTKFPIGKTGTSELVSLFRQIEGENVFKWPVDLSVLDSLLNIRHNIVHQDANISLTETTISTYKNYVLNLCTHVDNLLMAQIQKCLVNPVN